MNDMGDAAMTVRFESDNRRMARPRKGTRRTAHRLAKPLLLSVLLYGGLTFAASAADCSDAARPEIDWSSCNRRNLSLSGSDLTSANIQEADLSATDLRNATLSSANLEKAKLMRASLAGAVADNANLNRVEGYRTNFAGISAKGTSFQSAELQRADFTDAALAGANFEKAELGRAHFKGAALGDNRFAYANLARADFDGAKIAGPMDFAGAYTFLMRIEGVDLTTATGLEQGQVDLACGDADTKLPGGLTPPASWPCTPAD